MTTIGPDVLAIHGGPKVRPEPMPPRMAFGSDEFRVAIDELFEHYRDRRVDPGYQDTFERRYTDAFVRYIGVPGYADAVSTGSAALFVAIAALQLPRGSHVIVSPITDPGTITAIILNNLVPVLADAMPASYNMGVEQFAARITDATRALVLVHAAGQAAPVDAMLPLALERGILVIEDCSQAHGATLRGRQVGTFGDIAAFSTMYRKAHATGGCGGVVFTRDLERHRLGRAYADRGKPFWQEGFDDKDPTSFLFPALNFNIDEMSCAIGVQSLAALDHVIRRRRAFVDALRESLRRHSAACTLYPLSGNDSPFFLPIFVDTARIRCSKREFARAVRAEGIDLNPHYMYVVGEWPWVQPYLADAFACTNAIACRDSSFNILLNEHYGRREVEDITAAIVKVERHFAC
jgi:dTDP-4-amino-4,6-dideoxygalactose transaminase